MLSIILTLSEIKASLNQNTVFQGGVKWSQVVNSKQGFLLLKCFTNLGIGKERRCKTRFQSCL